MLFEKIEAFVGFQEAKTRSKTHRIAKLCQQQRMEDDKIAR